MVKSRKKRLGELKRGMVSLYVVIFTTLLLGVITLSFIRIMMNEQQSASDQDLAQSAYDSALAGVEDAKRATMAYQDCLSKGSTGASGIIEGASCENIVSEIKAGNCDSVARALYGSGAGGDSGQPLDAGGADSENDLQQAYTCVIVHPNTNDYLGYLADNRSSKIIPLRVAEINDAGTANTNVNINHIVVRWFRTEDIGGASNTGALRTWGGEQSAFPLNNNWAVNSPPVLRFQLMQTAGNFNLGQLDSGNGSQTDKAALMLYPTSNGRYSLNEAIGADIVAKSGSAVGNSQPYDTPPEGYNPLPVKCSQSFSGGENGYSCAVRINLPDPVGGQRNNANTFVRLSTYYGQSASFGVEAFDAAGKRLPFNMVQPEVDSTGRASDLYRRVLSRVELVDTYFPYPEFAAEIINNAGATICKNFLYAPGKAINRDNQCANSYGGAL